MEEIYIYTVVPFFGNLRTPQFSIFGWPLKHTFNQSNRLHLQQQRGACPHTALALNAILLVKKMDSAWFPIHGRTHIY